MIKKKQRDERVLETQRKIGAKGFNFMLWALLIILLYRQFYLGQQFGEFADIFGIWIIGCAYVTLTGSLSGLDLVGQNKKMFITIPLIIAIVAVSVNYFTGNITNSTHLVINFILAFIGSALIIGILYYLIHLLYRFWEKKNLGS